MYLYNGDLTFQLVLCVVSQLKLRVTLAELVLASNLVLIMYEDPQIICNPNVLCSALIGRKMRLTKGS